MLVTRASAEAFEAVREKVPAATYSADAAIISYSQQDVTPGKGTIVVAAAGTSDLSVAEEAARTAEVMGNDVVRLYDVGVAGLHRILAKRDRLAKADVIIVVAGMDGVLPSVVGGLRARPHQRRQVVERLHQWCRAPPRWLVRRAPHDLGLRPAEIERQPPLVFDQRKLRARVVAPDRHQRRTGRQRSIGLGEHDEIQHGRGRQSR